MLSISSGGGRELISNVLVLILRQRSNPLQNRSSQEGILVDIILTPEWNASETGWVRYSLYFQAR